MRHLECVRHFLALRLKWKRDTAFCFWKITSWWAHANGGRRQAGLTSQLAMPGEGHGDLGHGDGTWWGSRSASDMLSVS